MKQKEDIVARKDALLSLLDDPSPIVMNAVSKELARMGSEGTELLQEIVNLEGDENLVAQARAWLKRLGSENPTDNFIDFIYSYNYELETGSLLLDRTIFPQLDLNEYYHFMDEVSGRCRDLMLESSSARECCKVINRVLFHEYGFRGNYDDYYNPLNSYIHQLVKRRKGIPISLSILYILIAERCNLQLEPIALPGHFLVGCFLDSKPFYIDPYHGGTFRTIRQVSDIVVEKINQVDEIYLKPASMGSVLCRCCRNLENQYASENNMKRAGFFGGFVRAFEDAYRKHAQS